MSVVPHAVADAVLTVEPLVAAVESALQTRGEGCGAVCTFVGVVRATHQGRRVRFLEYEAHAALAMKMFERISVEVAAQWPEAVVAVHHRVGRLSVGEASVVIAAASAHRAAAFQVCRYAIERVKQIAPVWKHEFFEDGEAWVEGPVADPNDEGMKRQALERACA
ncbi:MAG: molybdenum cofactor biosynthesis protein MoaE [Acidobacteriota bacterium]